MNIYEAVSSTLNPSIYALRHAGDTLRIQKVFLHARSSRSSETPNGIRTKPKARKPKKTNNKNNNVCNLCLVKCISICI